MAANVTLMPRPRAENPRRILRPSKTGSLAKRTAEKSKRQEFARDRKLMVLSPQSEEIHLSPWSLRASASAFKSQLPLQISDTGLSNGLHAAATSISLEKTNHLLSVLALHNPI
ncbi:hypothetical protein PoB_007037100 [Plakobranchus ocellatus]|uniref:Uncharacterized protein n=1 Tax=Plakobranchus ocellatus TaxID=259542 RepID=A0AAV4DI79_9GAST|nr:hypothetical protein PoB_007037100 [Plakobranchus ocellatus]